MPRSFLMMLMMDERWRKNVMLFRHPTAALWHSTVGTVGLCVCAFLPFSCEWARAACAFLALLRLITLESVMWNSAGCDSFRRQNKQGNTQLNNPLACLGPTSRRHVSVARRCWHLLGELLLISHGSFNGLVFQRCSFINQILCSVAFQPNLSSPCHASSCMARSRKSVRFGFTWQISAPSLKERWRWRGETKAAESKRGRKMEA